MYLCEALNGICIAIDIAWNANKYVSKISVIVKLLYNMHIANLNYQMNYKKLDCYYLNNLPWLFNKHNKSLVWKNYMYIYINQYKYLFV